MFHRGELEFRLEENDDTDADSLTDMRQLVGHRTVTEGLQVRNSLKTLLGQVLFYSQGRSQYEANRCTCLSHLTFDPSVLFKRSHHK